MTPMHRSLVFALALFCAPLAHAQQAPLKFDVVSIKLLSRPEHGWESRFTPTGYIAEYCTLRWIFRSDAFGISDQRRLYGGPAWLDTDRFTIEAKVADADLDAFHKLSREQRRLMVQDLLADRFHLVFHRESRETAVYAITVAKGGLKMPLTKPEEQQTMPDGKPSALFKVSRTGVLEISGAVPDDLANMLSFDHDIGRIVIDHTGLTGRYNITLHWAPNGTHTDSPLANYPDIFTALQEELGLKLESMKIPIDVTVIDSADHPTPN